VRERRRGAHDPFADDRVAADELPLVVVESAGLVQDGVRDGDLADVVQLGGEADPHDLVRCQPESRRGVRRQGGDIARVLAEIRAVLGEEPQQDVGALTPSRHAAGRLLLIHALVGEQQRRLGSLGVGRQHRDTERAADREALALLGERARREGCEAVRGSTGDLGDDAELVAAHAVRGPDPLHRAVQTLAEPGEQRIPGQMAERIVVLLEAVEVEQRQHHLPASNAGDGCVEVGHQSAAIAETGERVRERLPLADRQQPAVLDRQRLGSPPRARRARRTMRTRRTAAGSRRRSRSGPVAWSQLSAGAGARPRRAAPRRRARSREPPGSTPRRSRLLDPWRPGRGSATAPPRCAGTAARSRRAPGGGLPGSRPPASPRSSPPCRSAHHGRLPGHHPRPATRPTGRPGSAPRRGGAP
jgi:hypothetical protein